MFPILLQLGSLTIHTLGLFMAIGFFLSGFVFWRLSRQEHYQEDTLFDDFLKTAVWSMLVSRLGFIVLHTDVFGFEFLRYVDIFNYPGVSMAMGVMIMPVMMFRLASKKKLDAFEVLDFSAIAMSVGLVWYWIGAFFDGSLVGLPTSLPWGVIFPGLFSPRHPAQLYAMVANFLVMIYLMWAANKYRLFSWYRNNRHTANSGFVFSVWMVTQGLTQVLMLLVAVPQLVVAELVLDWYIYPVVIILGLWMLFKRSGRSLVKWKKH